MSNKPTKADVEEPEVVQRWTYTPDYPGNMVMHTEGKWVRLSDHNTIVERLITSPQTALARVYKQRAEQAEAVLTTERERSARLRDETLEEAAKLVERDGLTATGTIHPTNKGIAAALRELKNTKDD